MAAPTFVDSEDRFWSLGSWVRAFWWSELIGHPVKTRVQNEVTGRVAALQSVEGRWEAGVWAGPMFMGVIPSWFPVEMIEVIEEPARGSQGGCCSKIEKPPPTQA